MSFEPYPDATPARDRAADGYPEPTNAAIRSNETNWYDSHGFQARPSQATYQESGNDGVGALVCGILSLLFCGIVLGPIAIHLGGQSDTGMAKAGRVLGTLGLIFGILGFLVGMAQLVSR